MKTLMKVSVAISLVMILAMTASGATTVFKAKLPVFIISSGQSLDAEAINISARRAKLAVLPIYNPLADYKEIKASGAKTLIIGFGNSGKGLGAAGVSEKEEFDRVSDVITNAKKDGIFIIGAHTGGSVRRGEITHKFMDPFLPKCDAFFCLNESDFDSFFTNASKKHGWPLVKIEDITEIAELMKQIFN